MAVFEPSFGRQCRMREFTLQLVRDKSDVFDTKETRSFTHSVSLEISTFGQAMVQHQKSLTHSGSKALASNTRPNDGSKTAKR
jgi:hypothetical protein